MNHCTSYWFLCSPFVQVDGTYKRKIRLRDASRHTWTRKCYPNKLNLLTKKRAVELRNNTFQMDRTVFVSAFFIQFLFVSFILTCVKFKLKF